MSVPFIIDYIDPEKKWDLYSRYDITKMINYLIILSNLVKMTTFTDLPLELKIQYFPYFLDVYTLWAHSRICKSFASLTNTNDIWSHRIDVEYNIRYVRHNPKLSYRFLKIHSTRNTVLKRIIPHFMQQLPFPGLIPYPLIRIEFSGEFIVHTFNLTDFHQLELSIQEKIN